MGEQSPEALMIQRRGQFLLRAIYNFRSYSDDIKWILNRREKHMRYSLIGREIGIEIEADSEEEAIEKAEEILLQGLGGYVECLSCSGKED